MRISDWSSDVCSSDLGIDQQLLVGFLQCDGRSGLFGAIGQVAAQIDFRRRERNRVCGRRDILVARRARDLETADVDAGRSEEHTSELQSLMRISYAVFCLKKKMQQNSFSA